MSFLSIAGREAAEEPLTIEMEDTSGTRGHFNIVLSVRFSGDKGLVARCQGVPEDPHFGR